MRTISVSIISKTDVVGSMIENQFFMKPDRY